MAHVTFWRNLLFSFVLFSVCECCQIVIQEGFGHSIDCSTKRVVSSMTFQIRTRETVISVANCSFATNTCISSEPEIYNVSVVKSLDNSHSAFLRIYKVRRNMTEVQCVAGTEIHGICTVEVFVPPEKPTCDVPTLDTSMTKLKITCRTRRVYPDADLSISYNGAGLNGTIPVERTCKKTPSPTSLGDSMVECVALLPLMDAAPGTLTIHPRMMPRISDKPIPQGEKHGFLDSVVLNSPKVKISNCPMGSYVQNNYIMSGSTATCTCQLEELGYPPGQARWYTDSGKILGTETASDRSSSLVLSYNPSDPRPTFRCGASTLLNTTVPSLSYSPEFAYGPSSVITEDQNFDLCHSVPQSIEISCKVHFSLVNPSVKFTFLVNNYFLVNQSQGFSFNDFYEYVHNYRLTTGGALSVTCRATNSLFPQLVSEKVSYLSVREPPSAAPLIWSNSQTGETNIVLTEGEDAAIFCRVDGGVPPVNDIKLTCGSFSNEAQNKIVRLNLKVTKTLNGLICFCTARHVTGCYDKSSQTTINVLDAKNNNHKQDKIIIVQSVVGVIVILAIVTGIIVLLRQRRERKRSTNPHLPNTEMRNYTNPYITPGNNVSPPRFHRVRGTFKSNESSDYVEPFTSSRPSSQTLSDVMFSHYNTLIE